MTRSITLCSFVGLLIFGVAIAFADRAPANEAPPPEIKKPDPPKPAGLQMVVKIDPTAKVSRLILPPEAAGGEILPESGIAPPKGTAPEATKGALFESPTRSILAGLCLSLAIGAIFFVPRTSGGAQMLLLGVVGLSVTGIAAVALANKAPFETPPPQQGMATISSGAVKVEWTGKKGAPITLIIAALDAVPGARPAAPAIEFKSSAPIAPPKAPAPNAAPNPGR